MAGRGDSGFRKRGRRNGVASDFFRFLRFSSVLFRFFPFLSVFSFRFLPFLSVFFRFFPFHSQKKKRGDTVRETPSAKPRGDGTHPQRSCRVGNFQGTHCMELAMRAPWASSRALPWAVARTTPNFSKTPYSVDTVVSKMITDRRLF